MTRNRVLDFIRRKSVKERYAAKSPGWLNIDVDTGDVINDKMYAKEIRLLAMMAVKKMPECDRRSL